MKIKYNHSTYKYSEHKTFINRILFFLSIIFLLTVVLLVNLYRMQILHHNKFQTISDKNRIKVVILPAKRGIIYDRNGIPLAINRTAYQLELVTNKIYNLEKKIKLLQSILNLSDQDITNFKKKINNLKYFSTPIVIKTNLNEKERSIFAVNKYRLLGIEVKSYIRRYYPFGQIFAHVIGYVSRISDIDINHFNKEKIPFNYYTDTDNVGKVGIERSYEHILHGKNGFSEFEIDNHGKILRKLYEQPAETGNDVYLSIDVNLQEYIEELLRGTKSAVIVTNPSNGEILAMVSTPSYDPNIFMNTISNKKYSNLINSENHPLYNRTVQGIYPPASTVKPYIAISALNLGVINTNTSIFDPGWWKLPGSNKKYRDWKRKGHGKNINIIKALEESCDTFFYQVAYNLGIDRLSEWMYKFGYGHNTGIDINEEKTGNMPTNKWKEKLFHKPWYQGDTISVGIGQGYWTATPLQMVNALMILVNNGVIKTPHLLHKSINKNNKISYYNNLVTQNNIQSEFWQTVKSGMYGVANHKNGTAYNSFVSARYKVGAKSGTAQVYSLVKNKNYDSHNINKLLLDHKLMTAFAPYDNPKIAIIVILENGGNGISVGKITRKILDFSILGNKDQIHTKK